MSILLPVLIIYSGHIGHIGYAGSYVKTMGSYIKESIGDAYLPQTVRIKVDAVKLYDGMILIYEVTPLELRGKRSCGIQVET